MGIFLSSFGFDFGWEVKGEFGDERRERGRGKRVDELEGGEERVWTLIGTRAKEGMEHMVNTPS